MPEYVATTLGLYPLPDWSKDELSERKGHQKNDLVSGDESPAVTAVYDEARAEIIDLQQDTDLDLVVEGQLRWDDMLSHPLCVHHAVETRGLLRYYDNNNFYREPVVVNDLTPDGDIARDLKAAASRTNALQGVIPGPYSLFDLATDDYYGSDEEFLAALGEFLAGEVEDCPAMDALFVLEPSLVTNPPDQDLIERTTDALDGIIGAADTDVVVQTYWGSPEEATHAGLLETDATGIGYDLISAPEESLDLVAEYGATEAVALGVVDAQNTHTESAKEVRELLDWFVGELPPKRSIDTVYVTVNTELFYLPVPKFEEKLAVLGEAIQPEVTA